MKWKHINNTNICIAIKSKMKLTVCESVHINSWLPFIDCQYRYFSKKKSAIGRGRRRLKIKKDIKKIQLNAFWFNLILLIKTSFRQVEIAYYRTYCWEIKSIWRYMFSLKYDEIFSQNKNHCFINFLWMVCILQQVSGGQWAWVINVIRRTFFVVKVFHNWYWGALIWSPFSIQSKSDAIYEQPQNQHIDQYGLMFAFGLELIRLFPIIQFNNLCINPSTAYFKKRQEF